MSAAPVKRKLAAILAADAVGYSRMMAADEEGTMRILSAHRSVIDGIIQFHEGRIINTAGDSVLAEFASPTQAVRCAVEIQDALKTRNDSLPEERRLHFRIGVNLGDVMVKGEDLLGDGVNVAARLEGIAEPGEIYLSSSVYDQIAGKLDLGFVDMGEQSLKNIDRPVRAYRVDRGGGRAKPRARKTRAPIGPWIAAGLAVAALGAGGAWYLAEQSRARDEQAKSAAAAELARARAGAEEAKKSAVTAAASAEAARRALEEQRVAETRARAQAELAAARAEAQATRRNADAELASAAQARRAAESAARAQSAAVALAAPAPAAAPAATARWGGILACGSLREAPPAAFEVVSTSVGDEFEVSRGSRDQPGSFHMTGTRRADGTMQLAGRGIAGRAEIRGKPFPVALEGRFSGSRYEGRGKLGGRDCAVLLMPEAEYARYVAARTPPGAWTATFACAALGAVPPASFAAQATLEGDVMQVRAGRPGEPGSLQMTGTRQPDGRLLLSGSGLSGLAEQRGKAYSAAIRGRFAEQHFRGRGTLGTRDCALTIARK
jgi:class 3 adenylate cyclase